MTAVPRSLRRRATAPVLAFSVLAGCSSHAATSATTAPPPSTTDERAAVTIPPTGSSSPRAPYTTVEPDCSDTSVATYDFIGTMHTVLPNNQPITATITPDRDTWCTGGHGEADVTLTNTGQGTERVQDARLVLHGGAAKWTLQEWPAFDLAPGESRTHHASFTLPGVNPGRYGLIVYGYNAFVNITVDGPEICATTDLNAVGKARGEAMSNIRTDVTVTNVGDHPCLLPDINSIEGLSPDGTRTPLVFIKGTYFGDPAPLASHVLPVGGQAVLYLGTGTGCLDDAHPPVPWSRLRLDFLSWRLAMTIEVVVDIDTACGLWVSSYGRPVPG